MQNADLHHSITRVVLQTFPGTPDDSAYVEQTTKETSLCVGPTTDDFPQ